MAVIDSPVFICGAGYVGRKLLKQLKADTDCSVSTLSRTESLDTSTTHYITDLDTSQSAFVADLSGFCVYYMVPPSSTGLSDTRIFNFLQGINKSSLPERVILVSTTGVYGNCDGKWINEQQPPAPDTDRGARRLAAEKTLIDWGEANKVKIIIFRVAGIYGPDKLPLKRLQQGRPVLSLDQSPWSNRIHIDDLVEACVQARKYQGASVYFNISDGHPSSMSDYFIKVAEALRLPVPEQISLEDCRKIFSDNMLSYLLESKKIDNSLMLEELCSKLKYPDLQSGLAAISHHRGIEVNPG